VVADTDFGRDGVDRLMLLKMAFTQITGYVGEAKAAQRGPPRSIAAVLALPPGSARQSWIDAALVAGQPVLVQPGRAAVFDAALPFGGYKQSGWGREMGHEVLNNYTEVKAVTTRL
jgi:hypothetical protein